MANRTTILKLKCPFCGKEGHEKNRYEIGNDLYIALECGHTIIKDRLVSEDVTIMSKDGRSPFDYQMVSAKFLEDADCNGLCLHEPGLGKTIIECLLLMRNPQLLPALIVVPSGLRAQWFAEIYRWTGMLAQIILSSREKPNFDMFDIVIVSTDTLRLLRPDIKVSNAYEDAMAEKMGRTKKVPKVIWTDDICAKFKHICVDESQKIKNPGSSRTQALRKIAALANDGQKARVVCLSGTNIEKHAGEYFVTLNLVRPELFSNQSVFQMRHCEINPETGKIGGLKNPERFREMTKDFIIRYKREQVLPDLPKVFRQFRLAEMPEDEVKAYCKIVKEFMDLMEDPEVNLSQSDILGYLTRMRHITGIAKVEAACEFAEEFLLGTDRKLVIFLHHKQAAAILMAKLEEKMKEGAFAPPLYLNAELSLNQKTAVVAEFEKPGNRILLASTLAGGVGLNMQFCSDCLIMERQWNPSQEEQAEGRFPRPGSTADKINAHYLIAAGTIDDFLTDIVEVKRRNVAQTLDGEEMVWDENSLIGELVKVLQAKGLRKWGLK